MDECCFRCGMEQSHRLSLELAGVVSSDGKIRQLCDKCFDIKGAAEGPGVIKCMMCGETIGEFNVPPELGYYHGGDWQFTTYGWSHRCLTYNRSKLLSED